MRTPTQALLWELWRVSRWELFFRVIGQAALWVTVMWWIEAASGPPKVLGGVALVAIAGTSMLSGIWMNSFSNSRGGYTFHLQFPRPIRTWTMVVVPMVCAGGASVVSFLVPLVALQLLFDLEFPLLQATPLLATCSVCIVGAVWSSPNWPTKLGSLVAVLATSWAAIFHFTSINYVLLLTICVSAGIATTYAVDRQRHGRQFQLTSLRQLLSRLMDRLPRRTQAFRTPIGAQLWFETRRSGVKVLLVGLCVTLAATVVISAFSLSDEISAEDTNAMWLTVLILCPIASLFLGGDWLLGVGRKHESISTFDATQPMNVDRLIVIKLAVLSVSVAVSWLVMACVALCQTVLWGPTQDWDGASEVLSRITTVLPAPWWVAITLLALVLYATLNVMLLALGLWLPRHRRTFSAVVMAPWLTFCVAIWDAEHEFMLAPFWIVCGWALSVSLVVVCVVAVRRSMRKGYLGCRIAAVTAGVWTAFGIATVTLISQKLLPLVPDDAVVPPLVFALGVGLMMIPLAAMALACLALASQRNA